MKIWMERSLNGCKPAGEEAAAILKKIPLGTTFEADVVTRKTRSGAWHRRYWALMSMIAENCERVQIEDGVFLPVRDSESAHVACKYLTGLYDSYALKDGVVRILKSTAFEKMEAEDWAKYWVTLIRRVHEVILPTIEIDLIEEEIARIAS